MEKLFLSHFLNELTPSYGNRVRYKSTPISKIACCDSSNSFSFELNNHMGTHVDLPYHFDEFGKKLNDYLASDWIFSRPFLLEIECNAGHIIALEEVSDKIDKKSDCLIIKTGFEKYRGDELYWNNNPGISPELGLWLRKYRPNIKIIGFDFISLTSFSQRELGKVAHKAFLHSFHDGEPIRIIEDMHLSHLNKQPKQIFVSPILIDCADGAPATILALV